MSSRGSGNPQSGSHSPTQGGQGQQGGAPTNEQLIQYLMIAKGLNRETASEEVVEDPDTIKQQYTQLQQLMCQQSK